MTANFIVGQLARTSANKKWACEKNDRCTAGCPGHDYYGVKFIPSRNGYRIYSCLVPFNALLLIVGTGQFDDGCWAPSYMKNPVEVLVNERIVFVHADFLEELETVFNVEV